MECASRHENLPSHQCLIKLPTFYILETYKCRRRRRCCRWRLAKNQLNTKQQKKYALVSGSYMRNIIENVIRI